MSQSSVTSELLWQPTVLPKTIKNKKQSLIQQEYATKLPKKKEKRATQNRKNKKLKRYLTMLTYERSPTRKQGF